MNIYLPKSLSLLFFIIPVLLICIVLGYKNDRQLRKPVNCELLKDGNYVWDCSSYYSICTNGRELPMECYSGLKLNPNTNQCDAPSAVKQCHRKYGTANVLYRAADPFNCQEYPDGDYEASACSTKYYTCVKGQKHDKHCPPGLVYNSKALTCDFASKCHKKPYSKERSANEAAQKVYEKATNLVEMRAENDEDEQQDEQRMTIDSEKVQTEDQSEKANAKNKRTEKEAKTGKTEKARRRRRRAISSFEPSSQMFNLLPPPPPSPSVPFADAEVGVQPQMPLDNNNFQLPTNQQPAAHYTIFNLYYPKNVKFNVGRSDKELGISSAGDEIGAISDSMELPFAEHSAEKAPTNGLAKDLVLEEIADVLIDAIKDL